MGAPTQLGQEWIVDLGGCSADLLKDQRALAGLFEALVVGLDLKVIGSPQWHTFPGPGGITGLALLSESHLAVHTFPEHGAATLSVYSCSQKPEPDFAVLARRWLKAKTVKVTTVAREVTAS